VSALPLWLLPVFFVIAAVYSTVGFAGGSSYLAALALIGTPYQGIPQVALVCNLIVSAGGVWHFRRGGHLDVGRTLPFIVLSVPMAFLGGRVPIGERLFTILLGGSLLIAGARMFISDGRFTRGRSVGLARTWGFGVPVGAALGFLAGLVGIGGGIFLAPVLLLSGWGNAKQTAAAASLFILVNSAAGLVGQFTKGVYVDTMVVPLALAAWLGGQVGSRVGSYHLPVVGVRRLLAALIMVVSFRLLWKAI
jgi:uncharacterized membrane protein YfcA